MFKRVLVSGRLKAVIARWINAVIAIGFMLMALTVSPSANTAVNVNGHWEVTLIKGTATVSPVSQGKSQAEAWADCLARIPQPSLATSGSVSYTCQTPKYKATATYSPEPPPRVATLSWTTPTQNIDGSPLFGLTGYRIEYGLSPTQLTNKVQLGLINSREITVNTSGMYYFAVIAVAGSAESDPSALVSKNFQ